MKKELLQQSLEALTAMQMEAAARNCGLRICDEAIDAIRAALAQTVPPYSTQQFSNTSNQAHGFAQPVPQVRLEMARRVAREYGTKDSQIDSGHLYAALRQCLDYIDQPCAAVKLINQIAGADLKNISESGRKLMLEDFAYAAKNIAQPVPQATERNFCGRCGQRTSADYIPTCTPPSSTAATTEGRPS